MVYSSPWLDPKTYHSHTVRGKKYLTHPGNNISVLQLVENTGIDPVTSRKFDVEIHRAIQLGRDELFQPT